MSPDEEYKIVWKVYVSLRNRIKGLNYESVFYWPDDNYLIESTKSLLKDIITKMTKDESGRTI